MPNQSDAKPFSVLHHLSIVVADIDKANSADPNKEEWGGVAHPKELLYGLRSLDSFQSDC